MTYFGIQERKSIKIYKLFMLLIKNKTDKKPIKMLPVDVSTKFLQANRKPLFIKLTKNALAKVGRSGDPMATPSKWQ